MHFIRMLAIIKRQMRITIVFIAITFLVSSCEFNVKTGSQEKEIDLGDMPRIEKQSFENIYVADENICKDKSLPITRFAIEYPDSLDVTFPNNERDHINIKKWNNDFIYEELSIGNSTVTYNKKSLAANLLEELVANFKNQLPDMEIDFIGKKKFKGEFVYLFQGKVDFSGYEEQGYTGNYHMIVLLPLPQEQKDMNAVLVTFIAHEDSEIKTYDDFETSGMIDMVWSTFRYIE